MRTNATNNTIKRKMLRNSVAISLAALLSACASTSVSTENTALKSALSAQDDAAQARYGARNPEQTLDFFKIKPGMTVIEALPGGGWYSKILLPYLGKDGKLVGVDYAQAMWSNFSFMTPDRIEAKKTWVATWTADAQSWRSDDSASVSAFQFDEMPESMRGKADAALFIRALHNLSRFEEKDGYLTRALKETYAALKPGGIVGVVQHQAREDRPDAWANGSNGYLKKSFIVAKMQDAGFEFVGETNINENSLDQAVEGDIVWRLPPSLNGARDDADKKAAMMAIGESHRMTLKFRKPS